MAPLDTLEGVLRQFEDHQAGVVLIGGWALNFHGLVR